MKQKTATSHPYRVIIEYSPEDEGFVARVPDLKYCTAFGSTYEEAAREISVAIEGWLAAAKANGMPIPTPGPTIEELRQAAKMLKLAEVARGLKISEQTLFSKVRRATALSTKQSASLKKVLNDAGLDFIEATGI